MTDTPGQALDRPLGALAWALGALIVAVTLALSFPAWSGHLPYGLAVATSYLVTWVPLAVALVGAFAFWRPLLAFRPADLYLGLLLGVVARAVGVVITLVGTGRVPLGGLVVGGVTPLYVFTAVIAPVGIAPLVEEPFFRGLLQGSLARVIRPWVALIASSIVFALVHTIADGWSLSLIVTLGVFALLAGYATQRTGRLGTAIVAHAVFNALAALITWPW